MFSEAIALNKVIAIFVEFSFIKQILDLVIEIVIYFMNGRSIYICIYRIRKYVQKL